MLGNEVTGRYSLAFFAAVTMTAIELDYVVRDGEPELRAKRMDVQYYVVFLR